MPLNEDEKAELVAYLDGELDDAATQAVEAKIATDPDARAELDALKQTWGMLDYLPKASPSVNFTHRTMERLTLEVGAAKKTMPIAGRGRAWLRGGGWAAAVLLALIGGYFAALHLWPATQPDSEPERPLAVERDPDWLEQLRKDDPQAWQAIKTAQDETIRQVLIKDQRDREWMQGQPKAYRDQWAKLQGDTRGKFVAKLRLEERQKHQRWEVAQRFWKELESQKTLPCRLSDFTYESKGKVKDKEPAKLVNRVETYVNDYLKPYMTVQEEEQLRETEGHWPDYPMALVEIASRRTPALPPIGKELRKFDDVPKPVRNRLTDAKLPKDIKKVVARYHQLDGSAAFATRLVEMAAKDSKLPFEHEYLASNPASLQKAMKKFYDDVLVPAVKDSDDFRKLSASEGKWPDFPLAIQELSRKHNLTPPWFVLPEQDRWHWDRYRTGKTHPSLEKDAE
jgi:hypothetical protein